MNKSVIFAGLIVALVVGYFFLSKVSPDKSASIVDSANPEIIIYWGRGCPHCEKVEKFISDNKIDQKVPLSRKEVWYNKTNQEEMFANSAKCPEFQDNKEFGVPFAFILKSNQCLSGDQPIIDWLTVYPNVTTPAPTSSTSITPSP